MESKQKSPCGRFQTSATAAMETLPPELIMDILLILPVKSMCRFRCVSKSWLALFNDPRFVEMHLARTRSRPQRLVLTAGLLRSFDLLIERSIDYRIGHPYKNEKLYAKSLYSVDLEKVAGDSKELVTVEIDFPFRKPNQGRIWILGSCNGLLCIMPEKDEFYVFNPCTRECKLIPDFDQPRLEFDFNTEYGFGFAKSVDDYKFVKISRDGRIIQVYSLRNDSWKSISNDLYVLDNGKPGISLNGAIHWVSGKLGDRSAIAAFDLVEENFKTLPLPDSAAKYYKLFTVGLLGDWLCLMPRKLGWVGEFWVMKDYGVKESWTRISLACKFHTMQPLCLLKSEKMLLYLSNRMLVLCDQKDGNGKRLWLDGKFHYRFNGDMYIESLVSPNYNNQFKSEEKLLQYWFK